MEHKNIKLIKKSETELNAYSEYLATIEVINDGDTYSVSLPVLTVGRLIKLSVYIGEFIKEFAKHFPEGSFNDLFSEDENKRAEAVVIIFTSLPEMIPLVLDKVVIILSQYLDIDRDWFETMDLDNIMKLFSPFLLSVLKQGRTILNLFGMNQKMEKNEEVENNIENI